MINSMVRFLCVLETDCLSEVSKESSLRRKSLVIDLSPDISWIFDSEELTLLLLLRKIQDPEWQYPDLAEFVPVQVLLRKN